MRTYNKKSIETLHQMFPPMMFGLNLVALLLGLLYIVFGKVNVFWNCYGFLMLGTLLGNIWLIAGERRKRGLGYLYLFLSALWMLLMGIINTAVSITPENQKSQSTISTVMLFSLFFLGGLIAANITREKKNNSENKIISEDGNLNKDRIINDNRISNDNKISNDNRISDENRISNEDRKPNDNRISNDNRILNDNRISDEDEISNEDRKPRNKKDISKTTIVFNNLVIIALSAVLYSGLFLAINLLREQKTGILEAFISEFALFLAIAFLSLGVLIIKLLNTKKYYLYYSIVLTFTIFMFVVCLLPFASVPGLIKNAEEDYVTAFGKEFKNTTNQNEFFRQLPFSLPEYFLGTPSKKYQVQEDILFYQGTEGKDKGLELYFDVYTPVTEGSKLPGANSVLIRIHGGGWTSGDKGANNFAQMNKYFATQGYVVFDIQYGLNDMKSWLNFIPIPKTTLGDFSIDDMVRHIGIFTNYLVEHGDEYQVNLDSVFISGGSAGGQLTLASGLGLASGNYKDILNPQITIKGLIPFYPAIGLSEIFDISGEDALVYPNLLINQNSPPCLIYQGSYDGLVSHEIAEEFRNSYFRNGNCKCAVIEMPFGGHRSDLYFSGYYNQVFLYYMERFLYQYR